MELKEIAAKLDRVGIRDEDKGFLASESLTQILLSYIPIRMTVLSLGELFMMS